MILRTEGVTKCFGGLTAVNNVSLEVADGEILGIIGPNGAGKTTFLNCISGFYSPTKGKIYFDGEDITGMTSYALCQKGLSRTFQIVRSFPQMTALDTVVTARTRSKEHMSCWMRLGLRCPTTRLLKRSIPCSSND